MAIVLMTGFPAERQRAFNLDALIEHVILKPFSLDQFLEQIAGALASRTKR